MSERDGLLKTGQCGQVLVYQERLTHSVWQDFRSQSRTIAGLERQLRKGVRDGEWVGWRIITIHFERLGN